MMLNMATAFLGVSVPLDNHRAEIIHNIPCIALTCPFSLVSGFSFFLGTNPRLTKIVTLELHKELWLMSERKCVLAAA